MIRGVNQPPNYNADANVQASYSACANVWSNE
jgi:hypothetical protein